MNGEQLYRQLKSGQINKSQLTNKEIGEVYKYMVDSNRVSVKEIRPDVAQNLGLSSKQYKPKVIEKAEVPKIEVPKQEVVEEKESWFDKLKGFKAPTMNPYPTRDMKYQQPSQPTISANPENELADLLSNLTIGNFDTNQQLGRNGFASPRQDNDRLKLGLSAVGNNMLGGYLSTLGTTATYGQRGLENRLMQEEQPSFYGQDSKDKSIPVQQFTDTEKAYIQDALKADKNFGDKYLQKAQKQTLKTKEGLGKVGQFVADLGIGTGQLLGDIAVGTATGVGVLPAIGARAFGQGAYEARQSGANIDQQVGYGALSAGLEMTIEKLASGIPLMGKGVADDVLQNTAVKLAQGISSSPRLGKAFVYLANMAGEGAEEMISEILTPIAQRMTYDENADWATMEEVLYSALLGAGISGVMGGGVVGNPEIDFNISESYNPTPKVEFNPNEFKANIPYQEKPRAYTKSTLEETIDTGLNQLYSVLDTQVDEQAIDKMINNLEQVKQNMPTLTNYVDNHIAKLNSYKAEPITEPTTNKNIEVEQTFDNNENVVESTLKGVDEDINEIDNNLDTNVVEMQTPIEEKRGYKENWGTYNQYMELNPYHKKDLEIGQKYQNKEISWEELRNHRKNGDRWDMQRVLKDKPAYIDNGNLGLDEMRKFAKDNGLKFDLVKGNFNDTVMGIVAKDQKALNRVIEAVRNNYGEDEQQRELGLALGYQDMRSNDVVETKKQPIEEQQIEEIEMPTAEDYFEDVQDEVVEVQEEYPNGTIIQAKNGETYKVNSKDNDTYVVTNERTKQQVEYSLGGLKRLGTVQGNTKTDVNKSDWQMGKEEFKEKAFSNGLTETWWNNLGQIQHKNIIIDAMVEGKEVPQNVINEYPNILEDVEIRKQQIQEGKQSKELVDKRNKEIEETKQQEVEENKEKAKEQEKEMLDKYEESKANRYKIIKKDYVGNKKGKARELLEYEHRQAVEQAIAEGKEISEEVLKDYPDLMPQKTTSQPVTDTTANETETKEQVKETNDIRIVDGEVFYKDKNATTAKKGYAWFANNKSRFKSKDRKSIILPEFLENKESETIGNDNIPVQAITDTTANENETNEQIVKEEEKVVEQAKTEEKQTYRYYLTQRPPSPGTFPKGTTDIVSFDDKTDGAWGYVEYDKPLTEQQISDYELSESVTETKQLTDNKGIAKDNEGNAIEFVYEVINANDLITSHTTELAVNKDYPSELQPRDRSRAAGQLQVNDIVNNLQPEFLGENPKISDGAPIIGSDNVVESGNGRTIALTKMYETKHKNGEKYIDWLKDNAETFGIDINNLPENPVLIRRRTTEVDRVSFVKKANESSVAAMSATETAKSDAEKLTNDILKLFTANESGTINTRENKGFINSFVGTVIPKSEQNKYVTDKGELSQEGLARIKNAIFYKAYEDISLMNKLAESLDNNIKNITNTLLNIAPKIVNVKTNIANGTTYDLDFSKDIAEAVNIFSNLKETGEDVEMYLVQESMFDNENTALIKDVVAIINGNRKSGKKLTSFFNLLLDDIENLGNPNQVSIFGEIETFNKTDVLEAALRRYDDANQDNQIALFQTEGGERTEDTKNTKRNQQEQKPNQNELKNQLDELMTKLAIATTEQEKTEISDKIAKLKLQLFANGTATETSGTGEFEVSKFYLNSLKNALYIPENVKEMLDEVNFLYETQTNEGQLKEAMKNIEKDMNAVISKIKNSTSLKGGVQSAEALLIHKIYIEQGKISGDYSKAIEWSKTIRPKITNTAQSLQALSMFKRFTADNILLQATRTAEESRTKSEDDKIDKTADKVKAEFDKAEKEKAGEVAGDLEKNANDELAKQKAKDDVDNGTTGTKEDVDKAQKEVDKTEKEVDKVENEVDKAETDERLAQAKVDKKKEQKKQAKTEEEIAKKEKELEQLEKDLGLAKAKTAAAKTKLDTLKKKLAKYKAILNRAKENEEKYKENSKVTQKEIDEIEPSDLLVAKIESTLKDEEVKPIERDFITEMVEELFRVAKESPLPQKEIVSNPTISPVEFMAQAIKNRELYKDTWLQAKDKLKEKYQDETEMFDMLSDYFEKGIKPTFSVETLDKSISKYIVSLKVNKQTLSKEKLTTLSEIVKDWYATGKAKNESMVEKIIKESGLNEDDARTLEKYIRNRMHTLTKQKKEQILSTMFKESVPKVAGNSYKAIQEMTNLGAFNNENYMKQAQKKLEAKLVVLLRENGIDLGVIAKQAASVGEFNKEKIVNLLRGKLEVNEIELEKVAKLVESTFNSLLKDKKNQLLRNITKEREATKKRAFYEKIVEIYNLGGFENGEYKELIAKKLNLPSLDDNTVADIIELATALENIPEKGLYNLILRDIIQNQMVYIIKNMVPASRSRKVSTVQAINQLLNVKTMDRNVLGNEFAYRAERMATYLATLIDKGRTALKGGERKITFKANTKIFDFDTRFASNIKKAAIASMAGTKLYGYDATSDTVNLQKAGKTFKNVWNPFTYLETAMNVTLDGPDYAAAMRGVYHFVSEQAHLDGINKGLTGKALEDNAKQFAENLSFEAFKAAREYGDWVTFKDKDSILGTIFGGFKKSLNKIGNEDFGLGDVLLKYARTGGVLLGRSIEFSPIGILTSYRHVYQAKTAYESKKEYNKDVVKEVEMSIARGIFGTIGFSGLGYALSALGIVSGDDDDDRLVSELRRSIGLGNYQINMSALFRYITSFDKEDAKKRQGDKLFTYNWAMPMALSFGLGVDVERGMSKKTDDMTSDMITGVMASIDGMMSMFGQSNIMTGINNLFKGYDRGKNIRYMAQNTVTGFTGTFNNQLRQFFDNTYRDTTADSFVEETINKIKNRFPIFSESLPESIDITGYPKEVFQNDSNTIFNVFINPGFLTEYEVSPGIELMLELYEDTESMKVIPNEAPKSLTINSINIPLTDEEIRMYKETLGKTTIEYMDRIALNEDFKKLNKEVKTAQVEKMLNKISNMVRKEMRALVVQRYQGQ